MGKSYQTSYARVTLRSLDQLSKSDWYTFHRYFKDREIADWNGAKPTRYPFWLFRRLMLDDHNAGERYAFGMYAENLGFIGSLELYDLYPYPPAPSKRATLGVIIGERSLWGQGYGREALWAVLEFCFKQLEPPMERLRLTTFLHNRRAQAAFKSVGFRQVGIKDERDASSVLMEITFEEWVKIESEREKLEGLGTGEPEGEL